MFNLWDFLQYQFYLSINTIIFCIVVCVIFWAVNFNYEVYKYMCIWSLLGMPEEEPKEVFRLLNKHLNINDFNLLELLKYSQEVFKNFFRRNMDNLVMVDIDTYIAVTMWFRMFSRKQLLNIFTVSLILKKLIELTPDVLLILDKARVTYPTTMLYVGKIEYITTDKFFGEYALFSLMNIYNFIKTTLIAVLIALIYALYVIYYFQIQILKQLSIWLIVGGLGFWLISGFNFFLKRYKYGKFTSNIQRFWKRANVCFWVIEGFLFSLFFYYFLNSSQEPVYMYDYSSLNQEYLISLTTTYWSLVLISFTIYTLYYIMLSLNFLTWNQLMLYLLVASISIFYNFFIETYQFYYVTSSFVENLWVFSEDQSIWLLEAEAPRIRVKQQYFLICLVAKYWHFLFIFLSWIFFLVKSYETKKVNYVLLGLNLQNMIILYGLNIVFYVQWVKWLFKRFFDLPYFWFFVSNDSKQLNRFMDEVLLVFLSLFSINIDLNYFSIRYISDSLWLVNSLSFWKFL